METLWWVIGGLGNVGLFLTRSKWLSLVVRVVMCVPLVLDWALGLNTLGMGYYVLLLSAVLGSVFKDEWVAKQASAREADQP